METSGLGPIFGYRILKPNISVFLSNIYSYTEAAYTRSELRTRSYTRNRQASVIIVPYIYSSTQSSLCPLYLPTAGFPLLGDARRAAAAAERCGDRGGGAGAITSSKIRLSQTQLLSYVCEVKSKLPCGVGLGLGFGLGLGLGLIFSRMSGRSLSNVHSVHSTGCHK